MVLKNLRRFGNSWKDLGSREDLGRHGKIWEDMGRFGKAREDLERLWKTWKVLGSWEDLK